MKKLGLLVAAVAATVGLGASTASAYGGAPMDLTLSSSTVTPGATVVGLVTFCAPGEELTLTVDNNTFSGACVGAAGAFRPLAASPGSGEITFTAPTTPGTYQVVVTGATSGETATATLTVVGEVAPTTVAPGAPGAPGVPAGELPATGADSGDIARNALFAVAAGLVLIGGTHLRRRHNAG